MTVTGFRIVDGYGEFSFLWQRDGIVRVHDCARGPEACYDRAMRIVAVVLLCLGLCSSALAESPRGVANVVTAQRAAFALLESEALAGARARARWARLTQLRLEIRADRQTAGVVLLGLGLASVAVGGALAVVGRDEKMLLAAGITTASFGAVNAGLSFGMLDVSGADERRIRAARNPDDFEARREAELVAHLHSGQFFAVNAGLDVFYMAAGGLLCAIAAIQNENDRWELGTGIALIAQGAWLMAFDIINWINSNDRATHFRALH